MIHARLAQPADAPALKTLNDLFNGEGTSGISEIEASLKANKQEIVCVATDGDALVGFCLWAPLSSTQKSVLISTLCTMMLAIF